MANRGEKPTNAVTESRDAYDASYQIAAVTKPLNSISKTCDRGESETFGSNGGFIVNNVSGEEMFFTRRQGVYVMHLWIPEEASSITTSSLSFFVLLEM